jgi:nucleoside-diphosphate-sugar epimerase
MAKKVLILGGTGYVGRVMVARFLKEGWECRNFDLVKAVPEQCPWLEGDIRHFERLDAVIAEGKPDLVVNSTAAVPLVDSESAFNSTNIDGVRMVLESCLRNKIPKVLHLSTCGIYGVPPRVPILEDTPPTPADKYGRSKAKGEAVVREYVAKGLDVSIVRPRSMIGYKRLGIFHVAFELYRCGKSMFTFGDGKNRIQFLHVEDFIDGCYRVCQRTGPEVFNFGAQEFQTLRKDLEGLARHAGTGSRVRYFPYSLAVAGLEVCYRLGVSPIVPYQFRLFGHNIYFDVSKAVRELGWRSRYSNLAMLTESYDWYRENWDRENSDASVQTRPLSLGVNNLVKLLPF